MSETLYYKSSLWTVGCEPESSVSLWIYVFLGNVLRGIGETPVQPLGISYIDDYTLSENTALYIGNALYALSVSVALDCSYWDYFTFKIINLGIGFPFQNETGLYPVNQKICYLFFSVPSKF